MATSGTYAGAGLASIDAKGRITLPSDLRDALFAASSDRAVVMSMHPELDCLVGFAENEQQRRQEAIRYQWERAVDNDSEFDAEGAAVADYGLNFKANCEANGRFVLNPDLRDMALIESHGFIYGAGHHFCIWNPHEFLKADLGPNYRRIRRYLELQLKKEGLQ